MYPRELTEDDKKGVPQMPSGRDLCVHTGGSGWGGTCAFSGLDLCLHTVGSSGQDVYGPRAK